MQTSAQIKGIGQTKGTKKTGCACVRVCVLVAMSAEDRDMAKKSVWDWCTEFWQHAEGQREEVKRGVKQLAGGWRRNSERPRRSSWYKTTGGQIWARLMAEVGGKKTKAWGGRNLKIYRVKQQRKGTRETQQVIFCTDMPEQGHWTLSYPAKWWRKWSHEMTVGQFFLQKPWFGTP